MRLAAELGEEAMSRPVEEAFQAWWDPKARLEVAGEDGRVREEGCLSVKTGIDWYGMIKNLVGVCKKCFLWNTG